MDADGDGWDTPADCDDQRAESYPSATELCDGLDNDCDGATAAFEQDGDGDGAMDCEALLWAVAVIGHSRYTELVDAIVAGIEARASESCPALSENSSSQQVQARDGSSLSVQQQQILMTGGCSSATASFSGEAGFMLYDQPFQPVDSSWNGELRGQAMEVTGFSLTEAGASTALLALSGTIVGREEALTDAAGRDQADEWGEISLTLNLNISSPLDGVPEFLQGAAMELQIEQDHGLTTCHMEAGCDFEEESFTTRGSAVRSNAQGDWHAETSGMGWMFRFERSEPDQPLTETGCYLEPETGSVEVRVLASGAAEPSFSASMRFDGGERCDGCGEVTIENQAVGRWCGLAPLEEPS
ncbi:MAG: hypothetical protein CMP23_13795 [Rickettsiales bacterium]|nr:hypothetical protein [Rickettsiales bacterium]